MFLESPNPSLSVLGILPAWNIRLVYFVCRLTKSRDDDLDLSNSRILSLCDRGAILGGTLSGLSEGDCGKLPKPMSLRFPEILILCIQDLELPPTPTTK